MFAQSRRTVWPLPVRDYVQRSFDPENMKVGNCRRQDVEIMLKKIITIAAAKDQVDQIDWTILPLPHYFIAREKLFIERDPHHRQSYNTDFNTNMIDDILSNTSNKQSDNNVKHNLNSIDHNTSSSHQKPNFENSTRLHKSTDKKINVYAEVCQPSLFEALTLICYVDMRHRLTLPNRQSKVMVQYFQIFLVIY